MWLVVGVKSICDEDWDWTNSFQSSNCFSSSTAVEEEPETNKVIKLRETSWKKQK
jgi:hypothetical protein